MPNLSIMCPNVCRKKCEILNLLSLDDANIQRNLISATEI